MADIDREIKLQGTFGQCLRFLIFEHGTRPDGSPDKPGTAWVQKRFADTVGVSDRTVRYWLDDEKSPGDLIAIERALFGTNKLYDAWRMTLRRAHRSPNRQDGDEVSAPSAPPSGQIRHPDIRPVPGFIGREEMLRTLDARLWKGGHTVAIRNAADATVAMRGLGGVGKTVLARSYAWEQRERYHGLWWIRAEAPDTLTADLVELGERLGLARGDLEPEPAARQTLDYLAQSKPPKPWLLIYDNVEDKALLRRFTPPEAAHLLYTTRLPDWFGEADELPVDVFPRDTAIDFLLAHASPAETRDSAGRLADALGRLPLALAQARALCKSRRLSFDAYIAQLSALLDTMPKAADTDYPNTVFATFSLAMDRARGDCAAAEKLMGLIAHFAPDQIPLWLIPGTVMPEAERGEALETLAGLSLITHESLADGTAAISVHRLVQEVARVRLRKAGEAEGYAAMATQIIEVAYDATGSFAGASKNTAWLPHALAILAHAPQDTDAAYHTIWTCNQIGDFRLSRGELFRAKDAYEAGLKIASGLAAASPDNAAWQRDLSVAQDKIGDVLSAQGNLPEALKAYQASLAIANKLAKDDPGNAGWQRDLSVSQNKIGDVLSAQGNLPEALKAYQASLAIANKLAKDDPGNAGWQADLAASHGKLGQLQKAMGNIDEARRMWEVGRAIVEPFAEKSGHQLWIGYLRSFDAALAALDAGE